MSNISRTERSDRTRTNLLAAGLEIIKEEPADLIFDRLDSRTVSARAGVTSGAYYHHFDGSDGYIEALLQYCLQVPENRPFAVATPTFEQAIADGASFVDAFTAAATALIRYQDTNVTFVLQAAVWAKRAKSVDITKRLQRMYENVRAEVGGYFAAMLNVMNREMRPPYTPEDLAGMSIAINEGLTLQRGVDPKAVPDDRFGEAFNAVIAMMTKERDDDRDVSTWLHEHGPTWPHAAG